MMDGVRVLNFDNSLMRQADFLGRFNPTIVDLKHLGPACRLWASATAANAVAAVLDPRHKSALTFYGSGDYHHISSILLRQFAGPLTVLVFDHHPDWDILPPKIACGAWVSRALEMPHVAKVIVVGVASGDIAAPSAHTGNLKALKSKRLEIYPYQYPPTKVWTNTIRWPQLNARNFQEVFGQVVGVIPTEKVYVSVDKDCLTSQDCLSNWEQGKLSLDQVLEALAWLKQYKDIVGMDVTGEYSLPRYSNPIKALISIFDHPNNFSAKGHPPGDIDAINEATNIRLAQAVLAN